MSTKKQIKLEDITKEDFQAYETVRSSGLTNMFAVNVVTELSEKLANHKLSKEMICAVMHHYSDLKAKWPDVRKDD